VGGRIRLCQLLVGLDEGAGQSQGEGGEDAGGVGKRGGGSPDGWVGEDRGIQGGVQGVQDMSAVGGTAGVVVGDGDAGQDGDELCLLSGSGGGEQGSQLDAVVGGGL
jgi:hypothetical protein